MNLLKQTKEISKLYGIVPSRTKGQNFLIDENVYDDIVEEANINKDDIVLEVGPGLGFLTARLAKKAKQVIAVELDDKLANFLKNAIKEQEVKNVEILNQNVLDFDIASTLHTPPFGHPSQEGIVNSPLERGGLRSFAAQDGVCKTKKELEGVSKFKVVANLPYNITSVFLRKTLSENKIKPEMMVLMLQKEVAQRICAGPGDMSLLACSVQFYAEPKIILDVPARAFWPEPKVNSAVVKLEVKSKKLEGVDEKKFFQLLKFGFSSKRKMLKNNLAVGFRIKSAEAGDIIEKVGLNIKARAEDLSLDDWKKLYLEIGN